LGRCYYAAKQFPEGIEIIKQAIALDPLESFYFYLLGFGQYQLNKGVDAIANLKRALQLNPYNSEYYGLLAYVLLHEKKFEEALEKANEGLALIVTISPV
jgi:tetratricopeptide (TPR) repeat protein